MSDVVDEFAAGHDRLAGTVTELYDWERDEFVEVDDRNRALFAGATSVEAFHASRAKWIRIYDQSIEYVSEKVGVSPVFPCPTWLTNVTVWIVS